MESLMIKIRTLYGSTINVKKDERGDVKWTYLDLDLDIRKYHIGYSLRNNNKIN